MSPEAIGAILIGLTGLVTAFGTIAQTRSRRRDTELAELRDDLSKLRRRQRRTDEQVLLAEQYVVTLRTALIRNGLTVPPAPEGFGDDYYDDEDDEPTPPSRRHRANPAPSADA